MDDYLILKDREGLVYSKSHSFSDKKKFIRNLPSRKLSHKNYVFHLLHYGNLFTTSTISFSLNEKTKNNFFNESSKLRTWEDYEFFVRLLNNCSIKPYFTNKIGAKYRISDSQNSSFLQDIKNVSLISNFFASYYKIYKIKRIKKLPLWAHYTNMISFYSSGNYKDSFLSLVNVIIISFITIDFPFLFKSIIKYLFLIFNIR